MAYVLTYEEAGFLKLVYDGPAKMDDLKEVITAGALLALEKDCFRVLSDFRSMTLDLSVMDLYSIPALQAFLSKDLAVHFSKFRRALLVKPGDYERFKFFETVAINRAHTVMIFVELNDAMKWLMRED